MSALYLGKKSLDLLSAFLYGYGSAKIEEDPYYGHYTKEFNTYVEIYYKKTMPSRLDQIKEVVALQKEATDAQKNAVYLKKLNEIEVSSPLDASGLIRTYAQNDIEATDEFFRLFHQFVEEMEVLD